MAKMSTKAFRMSEIARDLDGLKEELDALNFYVNDPAIMFLLYSAQEKLLMARAAINELSRHAHKEDR